MNKFYIVGTPIGNLKDITLRALETLEMVDIVACEDTRVTAKLLNHYNISKKMVSYNDHNAKHSLNGLIKLWNEGNNIALVSDAGMPVISDPGFKLIEELVEKNIPFELIPGPSATITTLVLSNINPNFKFLGFLKPKSEQRRNELSSLAPGSYVAFVSIHKILKTLQDFKYVFGDEFKLFVGRELTKKFETHYRGTPDEIASILEKELKGEISIGFEIKKSKVKINKYAHLSKNA